MILLAPARRRTALPAALYSPAVPPLVRGTRQGKSHRVREELPHDVIEHRAPKVMRGLIQILAAECTRCQHWRSLASVTPLHWQSLVLLLLPLSSSQINPLCLLLMLLFWDCTAKGWCMPGGPCDDHAALVKLLVLKSRVHVNPKAEAIGWQQLVKTLPHLLFTRVGQMVLDKKLMIDACRVHGPTMASQDVVQDLLHGTIQFLRHHCSTERTCMLRLFPLMHWQSLVRVSRPSWQAIDQLLWTHRPMLRAQDDFVRAVEEKQGERRLTG